MITLLLVGNRKSVGGMGGGFYKINRDLSHFMHVYDNGVVNRTD